MEIEEIHYLHEDSRNKINIRTSHRSRESDCKKDSININDSSYKYCLWWTALSSSGLMRHHWRSMNQQWWIIMYDSQICVSIQSLQFLHLCLPRILDLSLSFESLGVIPSKLPRAKNESFLWVIKRTLETWNNETMIHMWDVWVIPGNAFVDWKVVKA